MPHVSLESTRISHIVAPTARHPTTRHHTARKTIEHRVGIETQLIRGGESHDDPGDSAAVHPDGVLHPRFPRRRRDHRPRLEPVGRRSPLVADHRLRMADQVLQRPHRCPAENPEIHQVQVYRMRVRRGVDDVPLLDGALPRPLDVRGAERQVVQRHLSRWIPQFQLLAHRHRANYRRLLQRGENVTLPAPTAQLRRNTTGESAPGVTAEPAEQRHRHFTDDSGG